MIPLAERMRPSTLDDFVGQSHLVGADGPLRKALEQSRIHSMIFWGPPGVGKTTLAQILATQSGRVFYTISAVNSGVKDVREILEKAEKQKFFDRPSPILFIDEIHRFSKSQQDSLLGAVEKGIVTLIGATTENPSFEVIQALLSRCQVYILKPLTTEDLDLMISNAVAKDENLKKRSIEIVESNALKLYSSGDGRKLYNALEIVVESTPEEEPVVVTDESVGSIIQSRIAFFDKNAEMHYDIISAFIKSMRGSDPNAAVYYLARMLEGGEDVKFIARRMVILASEDVGLANPNALLLATSCFQGVQMIGMPEARILLSQTAIYLATSPKSNASYLAINAAIDLVKKRPTDPVPLHLRNAPTGLMKDLGYGKSYQYSHDYNQNFVKQEYLPDELSGTSFYQPGKNVAEEKIRIHLRELWKEKYGF